MTATRVTSFGSLSRFLPKLLIATAWASSLAGATVAYAAGATFERDGAAISGYDAVAYFRENQPRQGSKDFSARHEGATYLFSSAANRDIFAAQPDKYAPQFGGYCAYGASRGYKAATDPKAFTITGDKLYLNYNQQVQDPWRADMPALLKKAEAQWQQVSKTEKVYE